MALSNIRIEPRREITESAIGIIALLVVLPLWVLSAMWFQHFTGGPWDWNPSHAGAGCTWPLGMVLLPLLAAVFCLVCIGLNYLTHAMGETVCGWIAKIGWDPRPKQRYKEHVQYNRVTGRHEKVIISVPTAVLIC